MKVKKLKEMATCLLVVLIVTGCSKDEVTINNNDPVAVNFSAGIGEVALPQSSPGSRASDTEWAPNDKVGIFMVSHQTTTISNDAENKEYKITTIATGEMNAVDETPIYYPTTGEVDFIAYYPYNNSVTAFTLAIDVNDQSDPTEIDLLRAKADNSGSGYNKTYSGTVNLSFEHRLAKLIIETEPGEGFTDADLTPMTVNTNGMCTFTTYNIAEDIFNANDRIHPFSLNTITNGKRYEAIVILDICTNDGDWTVVFNVDLQDYVWKIPGGTEFESGKEYTWKIRV